MHGKVGRKIREIKKSLYISPQNHRLSLLQWETIASEIANTINDMPLALKGIHNFEIADVLTPNRLLLGRNNDRSPIFPVKITSNPEKFMKQEEKIINAWFETWLTVHLPKLMHQPKWFKNDIEIKVGDIVLFIKRESILCNTYQYGKVVEVHIGQDQRIHNVSVQYKNANENEFRKINRAVRGLVLIHSLGELSLSEELAFFTYSNIIFSSCQCFSSISVDFSMCLFFFSTLAF